jgi:hypothetical protein
MPERTFSRQWRAVMIGPQVRSGPGGDKLEQKDWIFAQGASAHGFHGGDQCAVLDGPGPSGRPG